MDTAHSEGAFLLAKRIRAEYREMPGLCLTPELAGLLWGLEPSQCLLLLDSLVASGYLRRTTQGAYVREDGTRDR